MRPARRRGSRVWRLLLFLVVPAAAIAVWLLVGEGRTNDPPAAAVGAALLQRALSDGTRPMTKGRTAAAVTISAVSFSMAGAAVSRFRQSGTTLEPVHPDRASALVTNGANSISRNPMYLGLGGMLLGHALWRGSWTALLPLVGFVVFIDRAQIQAEEAALREKFGAAYVTYQAATPRWIDRRSLAALSQQLPRKQATVIGRQ